MKISATILSYFHKSKTSVKSKPYKFYLWVGLAFLAIWLFNSLINFREDFLLRSLNEIWRAIYITLINFIFFEYTIPSLKFTWKRIHISLLLLLVQLFSLYSLGMFGWRYVGIQLHIYTEFSTFKTLSGKLTELCAGSIFSLFFFGIIKHIYDYRKLKDAEHKLRIEKQESELNYLRSQTNPHFLFNTLNNIFSLARDKSDLAPESILRLSKILRFMLYETGGAYINIEMELKIISDYIALEKLRYDDSLTLSFNYEIEDMKQQIPPLLLIPLVENAFKHGVSETRNKPFVDILLTVTKQQLEFRVINSTDESQEEVGIKENIGLSNLRRQLELLYKDYNLSVQHNKSVFTAILKINLASHV